MGEVVSFPIALDSDLGRELIVDLARFRENLTTEKFIRRKYHLDNATWERLGSDEGNALVEKIEEESARRIRDGSAKREKSQLLVTRAPEVMSKILLDDSQNARHRIDSAKVLNDFAANGPAGAPAADRFVIQINLGDTTEHYNKSRRVLELGEVDPDDPGTTSQELLAAITSKKPGDGGNGGQPI